MAKDKIYDKSFYEEMNHTNRKSNLTSAMEIVPYILNLFPHTKSVIDFGCGSGAFLKTFKDNGVSDVMGLDGEWVDRDSLLISEENFMPTDLTRVKDLKFEKKYDLAISVEVAEHIDGKYADDFVNAMTRAADVVVFGAAIPGQGGSEHVNEQWQSYWIKKFIDNRYNCYDLIRPQFAGNNLVQYWYVQNTFIFLRDDLENKDILQCQFCNPRTFNPDYAMPETCAFLKCCNVNWSYKDLFLRLSETIKIIVKKAIHRK